MLITEHVSGMEQVYNLLLAIQNTIREEKEKGVL
jgi:hypothetical protein